MSQDTAIRIPPVYGGNWTTSSQKMASTWPWAIQLALLRGGDIDMCSYAHLFPKPSRPQVVTRHVEWGRIEAEYAMVTGIVGAWWAALSHVKPTRLRSLTSSPVALGRCPRILKGVWLGGSLYSYIVLWWCHISSAKDVLTVLIFILSGENEIGAPCWLRLIWQVDWDRRGNRHLGQRSVLVVDPAHQGPSAVRGTLGWLFHPGGLFQTN